MKKKWPTRIGMEDSRPIFIYKRFSYNENALYQLNKSSHFFRMTVPDMICGSE